MTSYSNRLDRSLNILENIFFDVSKHPTSSFKLEKQACLELSILLTNLDSLGSIGNQQISREKFGRSIAVLFQILNHPEQSLRFLADQVLDEIFRKFILKFQAPKVIAYLLTEFDNKKSPARVLCSILQKLSWVAIYTRSQRADVYISHFLSGMLHCIKNEDDSVQLAIQRYFPVILESFGTFISASHTERAMELFNIAINNLNSGGIQNRASSTVISQLAKFVPSILHKSFYQLAEIILKSEDNDERQQHNLSGSLNTLSLILPFVFENMTQNLAFILRKLLCKILCCLYSRANKVVLASLEFLQRFVSKHQQFKDAINQLSQFNPQSIQMTGLEEGSLNSSIYCIDEQRASSSKSFEKKLEEVETMSCFSMRTGYSSSRPASTWNSLQDLLFEQQLSGLNLDNNVGSEKNEIIDAGNEESFYRSDENHLEIDDYDKISVNSAELFVDPLMNCLHQQYKSVRLSNSSWSINCISKNIKTNDGTIATRTNTTSGFITPISIISRSAGQKSFEDQHCTSSILSSEECSGILEFLPDNFCNAGANFWIYSALFIARRFLLISNRRIRSNREIRISYKILALNYIAETLLLENSLMHQPILEVNGQQSFLSDLYLYIGHDDDNLAIAALNFFFNVEKCNFFNDPSEFNKLFNEKSKLIWYIKKTLYSQRNSNRLKGIFQMFINAIPILCNNDSLLIMACEYVINSVVDINYFRVKAVRAEFLSKIKWSQMSSKIPLKLQVACSQVFIDQLFDKDPRVYKSTLEFFPLFVLNATQETNILDSFSLLHLLPRSGLPLIIGLNDNLHHHYQTKSLKLQKVLHDNFSSIFNKIYSLTIEQFFVRKSGFIFSIEVLINNFPLYYFPLHDEKRSSNISQKEALPSLYSLLLLFLDIVEGTTCSLEELGSIVRIITKLFLEISNFIINRNNFDRQKTTNTTTRLLHFWDVFQENNQKTKQNNSIERCLMLYLRLLNLFYSIIAEEKMRRHKALLHQTGLIAEGFVGNAAVLLTNPSSLILSEKSADYFSSTARTISNTTTISTSKAKNLSFLFGATSSHHTHGHRLQPTSYLNSVVLTSLEMQLRNAYKSFLESLKPESHDRFLDLFTSTMNGFCSFLEFADFSLIQPFIDELFIFLRMLMDISPDNSARLVSNLIKNAFNINYLSLKPMHFNFFGQNNICDDFSYYTNVDYLVKPFNSFETFIKFSHQSDFSEHLIDWMAGWMHYNRMKIPLIVVQDTQQEQMNQLLHQFEPFISRLLKLYFLTNSTMTKKSIFDCICILCLCNVRYELLDASGKFKSRVLLQLKQLSLEEDDPLLPSMLIFISLVIRVRCLKSSELGLIIEQLFKRIDNKICFWSLESLKIIIFDIIAQVNRKTLISEEQKQILIQLKVSLLEIFNLTFRLCPEQSAEVWLCLLYASKKHVDSEISASVSSDFIKHYLEFSKKLAFQHDEFTTPQNSPTRETTPQIDEQFLSWNFSINNQLYFCSNPLRQLFLNSIIISQCSAFSNFRIDEVLKCLDELLKQLINNSKILLDNCFVNLSLYICPMIFVLFNHIEDEQLLVNFCSLQKTNDEDTNNNNFDEKIDEPETFVDLISKNIATFIFYLVNNVCSNDFFFYKNNDDSNFSQNYMPSSAKAVLLFLILTLNRSLQSAKSSRLVSSLKKHLCFVYNSNLSKNIYVKLAHFSSFVWFLWLNFHFFFSQQISFRDFDALPSKCKYLLLQLLFCKIQQLETDNELEIEIIFISILDSLSSFSSKTDFLLEFLRVRDDNLFKKCINKLPKRVLTILEVEILNVFNQNWGDELFIPVPEITSLLPRLFYILAKSENLHIINLLTKINEIDELNSLERFKIISAYFSNKQDQTINPNFKFTNKDILKDNNVTQFYKTLLLHSTTLEEFNQICEAILVLTDQEIDEILYARPDWPSSKKFFERFFLVLYQNVFTWEEGKDTYYAKIKNIIQALIKHCFIKNKKRQYFPAESVFILAKLDGLCKNFEHQIFPFQLDYQNYFVERLLNSTFVQLFTSYFSNDEELPSEFYVALKLFFSFPNVKDYYSDNDCKTLKSLLLFFTLIWEHTEKHFTRWNKLNIDKHNWPIQVELLFEDVSFSDYWQIEEKDDLVEGIKKLFSLVQKIVHSLKHDIIEIEDVKDAFISLLANVSLFHRMALIPESALRHDWQLQITVNKEGNLLIPLIQIYLLNDLNVLQDFCFRIFSFGWSSRSQFEEFSMSLFGVLSSTPTTLSELHQKTESLGINTVYQQLYSSSLAVEALSGVLLQSLLFPKPGDVINSYFVVIHRKRRENFLFLDTNVGKMALKAKLLTNLLIENVQFILKDNEVFIENLEFDYYKKQYGLGQAALFHLWSATGLLEPLGTHSPFPSIFYTQELEPSILSPNEFTQLNDEYDTASSIRALFETFIHWLNSSEFTLHLPLSILHSTLRSLSLLSDLFKEKTFYKQTYSTCKTLLANNPYLFTDPICKGFTYFLLLKCASVLDWTELTDSGEVSTSKYIEGIIHFGVLQQDENFIQICSLYGLLYLLQSLALENLHNLMSISFDFVVKELKKQRQNGTLDCYILYQKLCWAFAFGILHEAVPLNENSREQFLQLIKIMFFDPQLPSWLILILTRGIESLVLHSCCYASNFRMIALEYFDIYQLQPGHLSYALSIYFTCAFRELGEGGEYTYAFNKNFCEDFLKILNIFSFYSNSSSSSKVLSLCHLLSDLTSLIWEKELVLERVWSVLMPPLTPIASPKTPLSVTFSPKNENISSTEFFDPLQSKEILSGTCSLYEPLIPQHLILNKFDQFLVQLIFFIMRKLYKTDKKVSFELMINFFINKLMNRVENSPEMIRYLTLVLLCSIAINEAESKRVHFLFQSDPFNSKSFKLIFHSDFILKLINDFLNELDILNINEGLRRNELYEFFISSLSIKNS